MIRMSLMTSIICRYVRHLTCFYHSGSQSWGRIAAVASFAGQLCFPQGSNFKQWTWLKSSHEGTFSLFLRFSALLNDGTIQVYLPAIDGHVPSGMVHTVRAFLEFCYLVRVTIVLFFYLFNRSSIDSLLLFDFLLSVPLECLTPKRGFLYFMPHMVLFLPFLLWTSPYFMRD